MMSPALAVFRERSYPGRGRFTAKALMRSSTGIRHSGTRVRYSRVTRPLARPVMRFFLFFTVLATGLAACDLGLEPPAAPSTGAIRGVIVYRHIEAWPPEDSLRDLRFFALPFVPRDSIDFFRDLNLLVFSDRLRAGVERDSFVVDGVEARVYVYSGVAHQFTASLLDWRPLGIYDVEGGVFEVRSNDTTELFITVDLQEPPPFPPATNR